MPGPRYDDTSDALDGGGIPEGLALVAVMAKAAVRASTRAKDAAGNRMATLLFAPTM
ncbi:hypothetical protein MBAV_006203 [Candidatus Magnetobacterium bavaricum]|uniref:Uncharacterized protein n=1 Tax=Candidatus Magnetobacterium bavaricum TaxID=29290 RepID=A0A0F3GI26_9BACT|nr:hypothetical protein MBAV_006203 [Candidatus Magnetobacterium bavaricum]